MADLTTEELIADAKAQLVEVKAAITRVLKSQAYSLDDAQGKQTVTKANLKDLRDMQKDLETEILTLQGGGAQPFYARPA